MPNRANKTTPDSAFASFKADIKISILEKISECQRRYTRANKAELMRFYNEFLRPNIDKAFVEYFLNKDKK